MKNPRPTCPNAACPNHRHPPRDFYRKNGYRRTQHNHQPVPRYQCRQCGKNFCATQTKPGRQQHRPDLNPQVFRLAVSGVSMRRMLALLGCSKRTLARKIGHLARQAQVHHAAHLAEVKTAYAMMDELETFIHARYKQVAVPMVVRVKTGEILAFGLARIPSSMRKGIEDNRWVINDRTRVVPRVLLDCGPALKAGATLATDGDWNYPKWISKALPGVAHRKLKSPSAPDYDPLFAINLTFAKMRNDLARLARKTWTTSKSIQGLENHLWLYVAWVNGYGLK